MHLLVAALIALGTLVLLAYAACREAPRRPMRARARGRHTHL
jgi:hypothetical protein